MWRLIGSSLLTRGKPRPAGTRSPGSRLIPAYAGKTKWHIRPHDFDKAHPCLRGENFSAPPSVTATSGSSLLTRGKRLAVRRTAGTSRLIPAYAGKTDCADPLAATVAAHPCLRGENRYFRGSRVSILGSSLLTRGKPAHRRRQAARPRLIPAYAGKTNPALPECSSASAHPCLRGENKYRGIGKLCSSGSSLLTRGKQQSPKTAAPECRLIPAYAGKTVFGCGYRPGGTAHPCLRGENVN